MKVLNIILTLTLIFATAFSMKASEKIIFTSSITLSKSVYRASNLNIEFRDLMTNEVSKTFTNDLGQYTLFLYRGKYEVIVMDKSEKILFKDIFNVPSSTGLIKLENNIILSGELYAVSNKDFTGYSVLIEGADMHSANFSRLILLGSLGVFEEKLPSGKYKVTVTDSEGVIQRERIVKLSKDKTIDFSINEVVIPVKEEKTERKTEKIEVSIASIPLGFLSRNFFKLLTVFLSIIITVLLLTDTIQWKIKAIAQD